MGHNVGKAAEQAVNKGNAKKQTERLPAEILKGIRSNLAANLAVTPADQRFLLSVYDAAIDRAVELGIDAENLKLKVLDLTSDNVRLTEKNEEFRQVYEQENAAFSAIIHKSEIPVEVPETEIHRFHDDGGPVVE